MQNLVLAAFADGREWTDPELVAHIQQDHPELHRGQIIPGRNALMKKGVIELTGKRGRVSVWGLTPPERQEAAREAAAARKFTAKDKVQQLKPEGQAQVIAALLENPEVNRILREQQERGAASRAAHARAQDAYSETEAQRRERKRELKEEERKKGANLEFLKVRDALRDGLASLIDIRRLLNEELERLGKGESLKISPDRWGSAIYNLREIFEVGSLVWHQMGEASGAPPEHCPVCGARVGRDPHALDEGYIEGEAVEVDVIEAEVVE